MVACLPGHCAGWGLITGMGRIPVIATHVLVLPVTGANLQVVAHFKIRHKA